MPKISAALAAAVLATMASPQERVSFPTQDGGIVYADVYGEGERGVVLAHGGRFTKESWAMQAPAFATAGFRVVASCAPCVPIPTTLLGLGEVFQLLTVGFLLHQRPHVFLGQVRVPHRRRQIRVAQRLLDVYRVLPLHVRRVPDHQKQVRLRIADLACDRRCEAGPVSDDRGRGVRGRAGLGRHACCV